MESNFIFRLKKYGWKNIIISPDFAVFWIIFILLLFFNDNFSLCSVKDLLDSFINTSTTLFTIVLAGFAIITSFTDKIFIYAWIKIDEYDNLITTFQINLIIPLFVMIISYLLRYSYFSSFLFIFLVALFSYMIVSLMDLVFLIANYSIQRGRLIEKEMELNSK